MAPQYRAGGIELFFASVTRYCPEQLM